MFKHTYIHNCFNRRYLEASWRKKANILIRCRLLCVLFLYMWFKYHLIKLCIYLNTWDNNLFLMKT